MQVNREEIGSCSQMQNPAPGPFWAVKKTTSDWRIILLRALPVQCLKSRLKIRRGRAMEKRAIKCLKGSEDAYESFEAGKKIRLEHDSMTEDTTQLEEFEVVGPGEDESLESGEESSDSSLGEPVPLTSKARGVKESQRERMASAKLLHAEVLEKLHDKRSNLTNDVEIVLLDELTIGRYQVKMEKKNQVLKSLQKGTMDVADCIFDVSNAGDSYLVCTGQSTFAAVEEYIRTSEDISREISCRVWKGVTSNWVPILACKQSVTLNEMTFKEKIIQSRLFITSNNCLETFRLWNNKRKVSYMNAAFHSQWGKTIVELATLPLGLYSVVCEILDGDPKRTSIRHWSKFVTLSKRSGAAAMTCILALKNDPEMLMQNFAKRCEHDGPKSSEILSNLGYSNDEITNMLITIPDTIEAGNALSSVRYAKRKKPQNAAKVVKRYEAAVSKDAYVTLRTADDAIQQGILFIDDMGAELLQEYITVDNDVLIFLGCKSSEAIEPILNSHGIPTMTLFVDTELCDGIDGKFAEKIFPTKVACRKGNQWLNEENLLQLFKDKKISKGANCITIKAVLKSRISDYVVISTESTSSFVGVLRRDRPKKMKILTSGIHANDLIVKLA